MNKTKIIEKLTAKFGEEAFEIPEESIDATIILLPSEFRKIVEFINSDDELLMHVCHSISGLDVGADKALAAVYHFVSFKFHHWLTIKVQFEGRENCEVETISDIYDGANWLERETFDLYGIKFLNHPDLRRILTPENWQGHPLLKDYETPETYQDVKNKPENTWNSNAFKFPE